MDQHLEPTGQVAGQDVGSTKVVGGERGGGEGTAGAVQYFSLLILFLFIWLKLDLKSSLSAGEFGPQSKGSQDLVAWVLPGWMLSSWHPSASLCEPLPWKRVIWYGGNQDFISLFSYVLHFRHLGFNR